MNRSPGSRSTRPYLPGGLHRPSLHCQMKGVIPQYGTVMKRGVLYYRTRIKDANGKLVAIYAKTPEELYNKETLALEQIENATFHRKTPTVAEYCEKWLLM